jgi:DNA-binding response OmpR family regulator
MKHALLIADGEAELCDLDRLFLTQRGFEVETSSDGPECLRKLRRSMPAALMLDLELRERGSDGVLTWLREESSTAASSVVLTDSAWRPPDSAEHKEPPVRGYLSKPFRLSALLESVRAAVKGQDGERRVSFVPGCDKRLIAYNLIM